MSEPPPLGHRLHDFRRGDAVEIRLDGRRLRAFANETVAAALLAEGVTVFSRSIKFHRPRSAFCLTGDCGACLMRIDGQPNVRACRTLVHSGLRCERQNAWPSAELDVLAAADVMFPEGMDHHTLMTSPRPLNQVMQRVVQQLGGLGRLPEEDAPLQVAPLVERHVAAVVVGGGPAGLAAARVLAEGLSRRPAATGARGVVLIDAAPSPGGSYLCQPDAQARVAPAAIAAARAAGVEILSGTAAIGFYGEEATSAAPPGHRGLLVAASTSQLYKLSAERFVYATGGHLRNALFVDNDRPGVMPARAVGLLLGEYGVLPTAQPLVVGSDEYAGELAAALERAGARVQRIDGRGERLAAALGSDQVTGAEIAIGGEHGARRRIDCDLIAISLPPAPASALAQLHGAAVRWDERCGFAVEIDANGRTRTGSVWACGEVTGVMGPREAAAHGERVGLAALGGQAG
ncbi:MAG: (2Fe-2S)-binding protein [Polyangia bacterium]